MIISRSGVCVQLLPSIKWKGVSPVKQGLSLTRKQKIHIASLRLNPDNWLISKKLPNSWLLIHRKTGKPRTIKAP